MKVTAKIINYDGKKLVVIPSENIDRELLQKQIGVIEINLNDGRSISADQRKKVFALISDIAHWSGHEPEYIRSYLTWDFVLKKEIDYFSLSDIDMTTAKEFINYLIDFCFNWSVPTKDTLLTRTDDISKYLYLCLEHRKCAICNKTAEVHHIDKVGMGRNREHIVHIGLEAIALCREHHTEAHMRENQLFAEYFVYGIVLDEYLCKRLRLNTKRK